MLLCLFSLSLSIASHPMVYAMPGIRQPHLIFTAMHSTRLHHILAIKISMRVTRKMWTNSNTVGKCLHWLVAPHDLQHAVAWQHALPYPSLPSIPHSVDGVPGQTVNHCVWFYNDSYTSFLSLVLFSVHWVVEYRGLCLNQWLIEIHISRWINMNLYSAEC